jgi:hypothetical protein
MRQGPPQVVRAFLLRVCNPLITAGMLRIPFALLSAGVFAIAETPAGTTPAAARPKAAIPGPQPDGSVLLPNQWHLRPAGKQTLVGDFPVNIALHPGGKFAAILHCGYGQHEIQILDVGSGKVASRVSINEAFYGIAFSPDGTRLFCSGSSDEVLHAFKFKEGYLGEPTSIPLRAKTERGIPCGLAVTSDGSTIYVANVWGHTVSRVRMAADWATADAPPGGWRRRPVRRRTIRASPSAPRPSWIRRGATRRSPTPACSMKGGGAFM